MSSISRKNDLKCEFSCFKRKRLIFFIEVTFPVESRESQLGEGNGYPAVKMGS